MITNAGESNKGVWIFQASRHLKYALLPHTSVISSRLSGTMPFTQIVPLYMSADLGSSTYM